ncbi:hypothetical protein EDD85DRAFT_943382 [Armillaria nabsnona]|nr:hypothetical protein EDD85DRAFT_943382 [Armillaria nabsnona]
MAKPTDPAEVAALQAYDDTYSKFVDLQENLPDVDLEGSVDAWVLAVHSVWKILQLNWVSAGINSRAWHGVETMLVETLLNIQEDGISVAFVEYNELVARVRQSGVRLFPLPIPDAPVRKPTPVLRAGSQVSLSPTHTCQKSMAPPTTPHALTLSKEKTPVPPQRSPPRAKSKTDSGASAAKSSTGPSIVRLRGPDTHLKGSPWGAYNASFSHPLKLSFGLSFGLATLLPSPSQSQEGVNSVHQEAMTQPSNPGLIAIHASTRPNFIPQGAASNPGNVPFSFFKSRALIHVLLGTDEEEDQVPGDLVTGDTSFFEDDGASSDLPGPDGDMTTPGQDEQMEIDEGDQSSDRVSSPPPLNKAHRLCQAPKISFIFNKATGDFANPHPTIFLPRPAAPPAPAQDLRRSTCSHVSPVNPNAAYLEAAQGSKSDLNKKKKDSKCKDNVAKSTIPQKQARPDEKDTQVKARPTLKKLKLKELIVLDEDEPAIATKVVRKCGPGPSQPLPVTLGVSGGGFSEKVPSSAKVVKARIKSIGMLVVDKDLGDFVEVDKSYWSKAVAPFVGEWYTTPCDHCKHLGTQCHKLLMHTVKCHYWPKGYDTVNTFEAALNVIEANNAAIFSITQQYLAGLSVVAHTDSIRAQMSHLRGCLDFIESEEDGEDGKEESDAKHVAPKDIAEGVAGPLSKKKHKSC